MICQYSCSTTTDLSNSNCIAVHNDSIMGLETGFEVAIPNLHRVLSVYSDCESNIIFSCVLFPAIFCIFTPRNLSTYAFTETLYNFLFSLTTKATPDFDGDKMVMSPTYTNRDMTPPFEERFINNICSVWKLFKAPVLEISTAPIVPCQMSLFQSVYSFNELIGLNRTSENSMKRLDPEVVRERTV